MIMPTEDQASVALERFCQIIGMHTGLVIPEHDRLYLREKLARRLYATQISETECYLALLMAEGPASEQEWRELVLELTTGESYFFRDAGQMCLLREIILPELLRLRLPDHSLRIWSAGCSTGEEPYSLAIMMQTLLPGAGAWEIHIKGTDINEYALQQARAGRYGRWAFRGVAEETVERYFTRSRGEWQLQPAVRGMVSYEKLNLIKDMFPDPVRGLHDLDLIVCRNVFIYFNQAAIAGIMARFAASLRPGGYILTGHAEVQQPVSQLVTSGALPLLARQFPDSVIFQRPLDGDPHPAHLRRGGPPGLAAPHVAPSPARLHPAHSSGHNSFATSGKGVGVRQTSAPGTPPPLAGTGNSPLPPSGQGMRSGVVDTPHQSAEKSLKQASALFAQGLYGEAIQLAETLLEMTAIGGDVCLLLARAHANLGEVAKAEGYCRDALRQRPFAAEPHFLLANLVQDRGDAEQAKDLLKKTLYLDHAHVPAYLQLATLYQEEGVLERARQMRLGALDVLHGLPTTSRVAHYEEWTVQELVAQLEKLLGESAGR
ncbi:MAG: hypothetical protein HQL87_03045 [Magnetococcales bacterium]|nr:hypothetical protein [Magnetococcales bacterium]